jgi:hypothetical protein
MVTVEAQLVRYGALSLGARSSSSPHKDPTKPGGDGRDLHRR